MLDQLRPLSVFAGFALALVVVITMGQGPVAADKWEYRIETDVKEKDVASLASDGWIYEGYLGTSMKGATSDETLWKRPKK